MNYSIQQTRKAFDTGHSLKYVFFWGHTQKPGQVTKTCFSQWYDSPFTVDGTTFKTAEHWMMAEKARVFKDDEMYAQIIASNNPGHAKKLGRKVRNFDNAIWNAHKYQIVVTGNIHKFSQHPSFAEFLLNTHSRILVEASPYDRIWGIGLSKSAKNIENPHTWRGQNLLGFALMEVRDILEQWEGSMPIEVPDWLKF